jgi:hypothetical protein
MVARSAHSRSSPAPSARRTRLRGCDRSAQPSKRVCHAQCYPRDASKMTQHTAGSYLTTMAPYKVCGCRPHEGGAARTVGPASANLQWRKPRGGVERPRVRRYGNLTAVVPDCEHNLCDMARTLRVGENAFRRPCNFKELRVVKRAHITTCALCACWQPLYRIGRSNIST